MRIKILDTETTKKDRLLKTLIGTIWPVTNSGPDYVIIDCCGGLKLDAGEYEII